MDKSPSPEEQNLTKATGKELVQTKWGAVKGTVTGLNLEDEKFRVNVPHSFKLHCEDLGEGTPDVACKPPAGAEISMSPAPGDNSHWVNILPKKAGKHELSNLMASTSWGVLSMFISPRVQMPQSVFWKTALLNARKCPLVHKTSFSVFQTKVLAKGN